MVHLAKEKDLERVNELRKEVNDLHVNGRPDIFRAGFSDEMRDFVFEMWKREDKDIFVAERNGAICGFACVARQSRPESPATLAREIYHVEEFGVDERFRRQGVATELIEAIRADAKKRGFEKIELNMWEFNTDALEFYEAVGFKTYRRYMECEV